MGVEVEVEVEVGKKGGSEGGEVTQVGDTDASSGTVHSPRLNLQSDPA